jgi:hypothetical protein
MQRLSMPLVDDEACLLGSTEQHRRFERLISLLNFSAASFVLARVRVEIDLLTLNQSAETGPLQQRHGQTRLGRPLQPIKPYPVGLKH